VKQQNISYGEDRLEVRMGCKSSHVSLCTKNLLISRARQSDSNFLDQNFEPIPNKEWCIQNQPKNHLITKVVVRLKVNVWQCNVRL